MFGKNKDGSCEIENLYVIYDKVAERYGPIFEAVNDKVAVRKFCQVSKQWSPDVIGDYVLYVIGSVYRSINVCEIKGNKKSVIQTDYLFKKNVNVLNNKDILKEEDIING